MMSRFNSYRVRRPPTKVAALLKQGVADVAAWNKWRDKNPNIRPDLSEANLRNAKLSKVDLSKADLSGADLTYANLLFADLIGANLSEANLSKAYLNPANLSEANLSEAKLVGADLSGGHLSKANLSEASLYGANLVGADLSNAKLSKVDLSKADLSSAKLVGANLSGAKLVGANLRRADLTKAKLLEANLEGAALVDTDLTGADLTGCRIYGVSAWNVKLDGAKQQNLVIKVFDEPTVTVDDIEIAQFIYLLLHNKKIRDVIDTIGKKAVLILGRFTAERKAVLDALREELRKREYLPILFDFDKPDSQDLTATVSTLAHLARFVIADITDPSSIPYELATIVPTTPVPVQPILLSGNSEFAMFPNLRQRYHWVLTTHRYDGQTQLIADLDEKVIRPAELKVQDLRGGFF
jgi:uncharacterized protein YjbI with pentapeptide repeats